MKLLFSVLVMLLVSCKLKNDPPKYLSDLPKGAVIIDVSDNSKRSEYEGILVRYKFNGECFMNSYSYTNDDLITTNYECKVHERINQ